MIGKIQRFQLREVWKHEERDFSSWLCENIDVLNEALGLELMAPERERSAGSFSVDLSGEDRDGDSYIIENQLERSDHDHLGKLVTYAAAFGAQTVIWIVADARPEHAAAVAWLNQSGVSSFYLVRAEAIRIGESAHALSLTQIIGPSAEIKAVGENKRELQSRHQERKAFWSALLPIANAALPIHKNRSPNDDTWLDAAAGARGMSYIYWINQAAWRVTLHLYDESPSWNKLAFEYLVAKRAQIDAEFGAGLEWDPRPDERLSEIVHRSSRGGYRSDESEKTRVIRDMVDAMRRLHAATKSYLKPAAEYATERERAGASVPLPTLP
jgi:hypothetical protein